MSARLVSKPALLYVGLGVVGLADRGIQGRGGRGPAGERRALAWNALPRLLALADEALASRSAASFGLLAVTHNEAVAEMQRTIRVAERVLTEAGVDVTPADFSPAVVVAENVTR